MKTTVRAAPMTARDLSQDDQEILLMLADENLNVSAVARRLFRHRNTILWHMGRIKGETGLDPTKFYDLVELLEQLMGGL